MTGADLDDETTARERPRPGRWLAARSDGLPGARTLVRRTLSRMFGPPPFDPRTDLGDPGLTGPGSASWRVIGEPAAIAGGVRGLLLQVAHPLAMAGVHDHSRFREDPLGRLHRTSAYVTATTFGSTREALAVSQRVRQVHPRVHGTAPDGTPYRADDPHLLTWVSIALTSSFLAAHTRWAPEPLAADDADRFVAEQSAIGALLDPRVDLRAIVADPLAQQELREGRVALPLVDEGHLPIDVAQLDGVLAAYAAELGVNHQGREALRFLRRPPIPLAARGGYRSLFLGAVGSLSPAHRAALELPMSRPTATAATTQAAAALTVMRVTTGVSPSIRAAGARAAAR